MAFYEETLDSFLAQLSTKAPVPGGGGASALVGAVAAALSHMVAALTVGKQKYAAVEDEMQDILVRADALKNRFLRLMDEDAEAFAPLAKAYRLPKGSDAEKAERDRIMELALRSAVEPPLNIMEACGDALDLISACADKGSVMAVSDAGVAAALCRAALEGASLNVFINTKPMLARDYAESLNVRARRMLNEFGASAQAIYEKVENRLDG
jgi:formiminotetrahydrofolate cyclodeaminase